MGQKLLVLLDSDMPCDVKTIIFFLSRMTMDGHGQVTSCSTLLSNTYQRKLWVRGAVGQESHQDIAECYSDTPACKNRCEPYSNTITHTEGCTGSLYFSSYLWCCINVCSKTCLLKSSGSISSSYYWTSRWISSFVSMSWSQKSVCTTIL